MFFTCKTEHNKIVWTHVDEDLDKLRGDVKQVIITSDGPLAKGFYYEFSIDKEGKETGLDMHFHDMHLRTRYVSKYDKSDNTNNVIGFVKDLSVFKKYQAVNNETMTGVYKYDNQGRIIKYIKIGGLKDVNSCIYKYNDSGDLIECDQYRGKRLEAKKRLKYDSRHLMIELIEKFDEGKLLEEKISYQYKSIDSMNNLLIQVIKSDDGAITTLTRKITYY